MTIDLDRLKDVRDQINRVDTKLNKASSNGLFKEVVQNKETFENIQNILLEARKAIDDSHLSEAETKLSLANGKFNYALQSTPRHWRFSNLYAGYIWIYLIGFLVGIFIFYYFDFDGQLSQDNNFNQSAIYATTWGCIGSILRGLWFLKKRVDLKDYENSWAMTFLSAPFIGSILGVVVYLLIIGGLLSITQQNLDIKNIFAIIPFSAFAGFNWEWAIEQFKKLENVLGGSKKDS